MPAGPRPPTDTPSFHFEDVELEWDENKQLRVKPPSSPRPIPTLDPAKRPRKKTKPLAASPQPFEFYPQDKCAVCKNDIAIKPKLDFIGHTCGHRGTCVNERCIRAYYGSASEKDYCAPYQGKTPLYCQAPGCGKKIDAWCYVKARLAFSGCSNHMYVRPAPMRNPDAEWALREARVKWDKQKSKEEMKAKKKEEKRLKKAEWKGLKDDLSEIMPSCCIPFAPCLLFCNLG